MGQRPSDGNAGRPWRTPLRTKHWKVQIRVKREHIEDDQIGQYSIIAERHGRQTSEFLTSCVTLLCAGFNTPGV